MRVLSIALLLLLTLQAHAARAIVGDADAAAAAPFVVDGAGVGRVENSVSNTDCSVQAGATQETRFGLNITVLPATCSDAA